MKRNIVLVGFMGVGKSAVANFMKENRNMMVIDTDHLIEEKEGCSIQEIFREKGEPYFRSLETKLLKELCTDSTSNTVISCGGGMVLDPANVTLMEKLGVVVVLTATPETIYWRVKKCKHRPLLENNMSAEHIRNLLDKRKDFYEKASDVQIETDNKTIEEVGGILMEIYTKGGDKGSTSLYDGKRVKKYELRVETYGTFDELNAHLCLCEKYVTSEQNKAWLNKIQDLMIQLSAELATENQEMKKRLALITREDSLALERAIDHYLKELPKITSLVMPGRSKGAAYLHVARTVSRRGERLLVRLAEEIEVREELLIYANRLSDFLYAMASEEDFRFHEEE